jgi:hypothetical protein
MDKLEARLLLALLARLRAEPGTVPLTEALEQDSREREAQQVLLGTAPSTRTPPPTSR